MKKQTNWNNVSSMFHFKLFGMKALLLSLALCCSYGALAQSKGKTDDNLINQFISAKGYAQTIVFSSENIKQFWVEKSVLSQDNTIKIMLNGKSNLFESVPLKIQLANVDETMDCKVDVISADKDFSFSILNTANKSIASSVPEDDFIDYKIASTEFHLEDALDSSFKLQFSSIRKDILHIKKIVLSFEDNKQSSYLKSPGKVIISKDSIVNPDAIVFNPDGSFSKTGVYNNFLSNKYIYIKDNTLAYSAKVKNIGNTPSRIYAGYTLYAKGHIKLDGKNFPFGSSKKTAKIISAKKGSSSIVIDSYLEWAKDCFLSLDAKDDLSDIPSLSFANGKIVSIKKLDNGQAEITMNEPLKNDITEGTICRVNARSGSQLYLQTKTLQPGETADLSFEVKQDPNSHSYSKTIPSGVYYVQPLLYSHSQDTKKEKTVQVTDFTVSY